MINLEQHMTAIEERNRMLAEANRKMLEDIHAMKQKIAMANKAIDMLGTCCGDWGEARELIKQWGMKQ